MTARPRPIRSLSALAACCALVAGATACDEPPARSVADSLAADSAAADSARAAVRVVPTPPLRGPISLAVSGSARFHADSGFHVSCVWSESNGERLLQVEALGRNARVNFTVYNPREGDFPVGNIYTRRRAKSRIGNFDVSVGMKSYADGTGRATITDPLGREGTISAHGFVKMWVRKGESHRADLDVRLRWECE